MSCIYAIKHKVSGFAYIGCTKGKLAKRMREHRCLLNQGKHLSVLLQSDWARDKESGFDLIELEIIPADANVVTKRERELHWMKLFEGKLYNLYQTSFAPAEHARKKGVESRARQLRGTKHSPESNEKRRLAQLGKPKNHGAKISATKKALGQKPSYEVCRSGGIAACSKRYGKIYE